MRTHLFNHHHRSLPKTFHVAHTGWWLWHAAAIAGVYFLGRKIK